MKIKVCVYLCESVDFFLQKNLYYNFKLFSVCNIFYLLFFCYNENMRRLFFVLMFCSGIFAFAQENGDRTVVDLKIDGLKKTKESYVHRILSEYIGKKESEVKIKEIETILQEQNLFSEISVSLLSEENSEKCILNINVKEKITFIPLPFVSVSKDGLMGGFVLMDMNALGKKYNYMAGGVFSKTIQMGMTSFSKPALDLKHPGFSVGASVGNRNQEINDFMGNEYISFSSLTCSLNFAITEKINRFLNVSGGASYTLNKTWDEDFDSLSQWSGFSSFELKKTEWNGWFMITNSFSGRGDWGYSTEGEFIHGYSGKIQVQVPVMEKSRMSLKMAGAMDFNKDIRFQSGKSSVGTSVLDSKFRTDGIMCFYMDFERAVLQKKAATVSVYGSYESVIARDVDDEIELAHGPGGGLLIYLKQIAFPAVAFGFAYNMPQNVWQYVVSLGVSF